MPGLAVKFADFYYIAPEIVLTAWGLLLLAVDFARLRHRPSPVRQKVLGLLALLGVLVTLISAILGLAPEGVDLSGASDSYVFFGTIAADMLTQRFNILIALLLAMVVGISMTWDFTEHWGEYFALLFWSAVGMMFLIAAEELITLFLTLETMTLCLYLSTALERNRRRSAEAGLKYFVYGSVSSALFLFGLSLIYGAAGSTRLDAIEYAIRAPVAGSLGLSGNVAGAIAVLLVMVGFGFKVAAVPFHQWAPDAYEGAPAGVTAWVASGSKIASFVALMKVLVHALGPWSRHTKSLMSPGWIGLVALIAALTMTYGNFAALAQRSFKRMLAYSSIAHAGYLLVGVLAASVSVTTTGSSPTWNLEAGGAVLFYLVVYGISTIGAFAVAAWLSRDKGREDIDDLNGLGTRSPFMAVCIVILMLSLIGVPPLAGFFGKLYMFMEALNADERGRITLMWLVALGLFNSVVSAFYYVRVLKAMYLRPAAEKPLGEAPAGVSRPVVFATLVVVGVGLYPAPLLEGMAQASIPMLSPSARSGYLPDVSSNRAQPTSPSASPEATGVYSDAAKALAPKPVPAVAGGAPFGPVRKSGAPPAEKKSAEAPAQKKTQGADATKGAGR
jgi:NADH-quinone oxidoreductase subunit N